MPVRTARSIIRQALCWMPLDGFWFPQRLLRGSIGRLEVAWFFDTAKVFLVRLIIHGILAEWGIGVFQGQGIPIEPEDRLSSCQPFFRIEPPSAKARIAKAVERTQKTRRVKDAMQLFWGAHFPCHPTQNLCGSVAMVITVAMSPMRLLVVIFHKTPMRLFCALPACNVLEMIITHPSHNIEVRLNHIFPALLFVNPLFLNVQRLINGHRLFGTKDTAIVRDQTLRAPMLFNSRIQYDEDRGQILGLIDVTG